MDTIEAAILVFIVIWIVGLALYTFWKMEFVDGVSKEEKDQWS